jgi:hypothetical protein
MPRRLWYTSRTPSPEVLEDRCIDEYGWSAAYAKAVTGAYRQFIRLKIELGDSLGKLLVPSCDVNGMWKVHVIDIRAYMSYCKIHCGGYLLKPEDPVYQTNTIRLRRAAEELRQRYREIVEQEASPLLMTYRAKLVQKAMSERKFRLKSYYDSSWSSATNESQEREDEDLPPSFDFAGGNDSKSNVSSNDRGKQQRGICRARSVSLADDIPSKTGTKGDA